MSLNQSNTDSAVFSVFMSKLVAKLATENKNFRATTRFLIDNARYHTNSSVIQRLQKQGCHVHFLGPYSWSSSTAEYLFAALKSMNMNNHGQRTGKG